ncbi:hypothetical protein B0A48_02150 [Cryoendolithus antarcticus]|uniref:Alpha N-terminal protein methyltransferase 1 n=1 Tax=Cryoendolithus antarcticus TaxID=1507870 RepID=A0A1V8TMT1_9PEZI|nr:hypothetical protein B0A48_02150 [Cryoendolithus antarcticus]
MPSSPKRKPEADATIDDSPPTTAKKPRLETTTPDHDTDFPTDDIVTDKSAPDSQISVPQALAYWSSIPPTVSGVLGGFPQVSRIDLQGSRNFLAKLRRSSTPAAASKKKLTRALDCGAGIGRVTTGFLSKVAETVDIVEPVKVLTDQLTPGEGGVGRIFNLGLEDFPPTAAESDEGVGPYDLIWNQWCVGQLPDATSISYLKRLPSLLAPGGWIVVKENLSNHYLGEDVYDEVDSSVTRTDGKFRKLFEEAGLKVVASEVQRGMPKDLFPVRTYALQAV